MTRKPSRTEKKKLQGGRAAAQKGIKSRSAGSRKSPNKTTQTEPAQPKLKLLKKNSYFIFGRAAVQAALENPDRDCLRLVGTERGFDQARALLSIRPTLPAHQVKDEKLIRGHVPADSPHQGIMVEVLPLDDLDLDDIDTHQRTALLLILDQVTDPHNVGACLRAGAALGATALITPDRGSPGESGTIARTSAGGLEQLPWVRIGNMAATLDQLKERGYWIIGMDWDTDMPLSQVDKGGKIALVMGSEGTGMRDLTRKHCDMIARIPMTGAVESLNIATAAAIALYELGARP